jgi:hypothetical protein
VFSCVCMCFHCVFTAETCTFGTFHMYTKIHMYYILYMKCTVLLVFLCIFMCFYVFSLCFHCRNMYFCYISHVYQNTYVPYIIHEMHSFASVFMCFHLFLCVFIAETCTFGTFHMYTKIHMYHILYMKCTVLLAFSCVFMCFHVFSLCFHCRNMYFWYISHVYQNTHVPYIIHEMHSFASVSMCFHVFSCVFTVISLRKHLLLVHFTCLYQNTHKPYILHEIHSFASILMCFHCVFTAETCTFDTFPTYTKIHMYHIFYMKCTVLLGFLFVFTVFSLQKHFLLMRFTCIPKYTCTIYST